MQVVSEKLVTETKIKQIVIPSSLTSIGNYAFKECSSLIQITIPSSVTSIGNCAFGRCSSLYTFKIIPITENLIENYNNQFLLYKSNPNSEIYDTLVRAKPTINKTTISPSVTSIGDYVFSYCSSLTLITFKFPFSVISIGENSFNRCLSLRPDLIQLINNIKAKKNNNNRELRKSEMLLDKNAKYLYVKHLFLNKTFVTKTKIFGKISFY